MAASMLCMSGCRPQPRSETQHLANETLELYFESHYPSAGPGPAHGRLLVRARPSGEQEAVLDLAGQDDLNEWCRTWREEILAGDRTGVSVSSLALSRAIAEPLRARFPHALRWRVHPEQHLLLVPLDALPLGSAILGDEITMELVLPAANPGAADLGSAPVGPRIALVRMVDDDLLATNLAPTPELLRSSGTGGWKWQERVFTGLTGVGNWEGALEPTRWWREYRLPEGCLDDCDLVMFDQSDTLRPVPHGAESVESPTRQALLAGARHVLGSYWSTDPAGALAIPLYEGVWTRNESLPSALQHAKRKLRDQGLPLRVWAGWVIATGGG